MIKRPGYLPILPFFTYQSSLFHLPILPFFTYQSSPFSPTNPPLFHLPILPFFTYQSSPFSPTNPPLFTYQSSPFSPTNSPFFTYQSSLFHLPIPPLFFEARLCYKTGCGNYSFCKCDKFTHCHRYFDEDWRPIIIFETHLKICQLTRIVMPRCCF